MLVCYVPACKLFKEEDGQNSLRNKYCDINPLRAELILILRFSHV